MEQTPGYQGVIEYEERDLAFEVPGRVVRVEVAEGDPVVAGALLVGLDDSLQKQVVTTRQLEAEAQGAQLALIKAGSRSEDIGSMRARIKAVQASETLLDKSLAREKQLLTSGGSTQQRVDEVEASLERTRAERQSLEQQLVALQRGARQQEISVASHRAEAAASASTLEAARLDRFTIQAPIDGTVLDVNVEPGEFVQPGAPAVVLADTRHPYAEVFVPQDALAGVGPGTVARVRVDSSDELFTGCVRKVARTTEFTPRYLFSERERHHLVVRVKLDIQDPRAQLHAGVPVFVELGAGAGQGPAGQGPAGQSGTTASVSAAQGGACP